MSAVLNRTFSHASASSIKHAAVMQRFTRRSLAPICALPERGQWQATAQHADLSTDSLASSAAAILAVVALGLPAAALADEPVASVASTVADSLANPAGAIASSAPAVEAPASGFPLSGSEVAILAAPLLLYALFNLYRDKVNGKAKLSDFVLIVAAIAVVGNIASIAFFRVRYF